MSYRSALAMIVLGLVLGLYEATSVTFSAGIWAILLPVIPCMVYLIVSERELQALVLGGTAGVVLDLLSPDGAGFASARFLLIGLLVVVMARSVLTNHSLYATVAMTFAARSTDRFWVMTDSWLHGWMSFADVLRSGWIIALKIVVADACLVAIAFIILSFMLKRFVLTRSSHSRTYG